MAGGTRDIKRRIKSVANTRKITKAMEMVAAAKMRKAVAAVQATRDYANLAWATVLHLSEKTEQKKHALLRKPKKVENIGLILIGSNRGLCGGFNIQVSNKAVVSIKKHENTIKKTEIITFGSKSRDVIKGFGFDVVADFEKADLTLSAAEVAALSRMVITDFVNCKYDKVFVVFTDYISSLRQEPRVKQLLPIIPEPDDYLGIVGKSSGIETTKEFIEKKSEKYLKKGEFSYEYLFEPNASTVLDQMLPRLIEMQIYQAVLESEASEHSSRMLAMRNATDSAKDMIDDLTLSYNRARQAGITQEIAEISAGASALKK
ncbi:MAG: ATP synthase F1 subunit gamma [Patescibacteria group bacterium]